MSALNVRMHALVPRLFQTGLCVAMLTACATVDIKGQSGATSFTGVVDRRYEVSAAPKYAVNESYTVGMTGGVGVLISNLRGSPRHFVYTVLDQEKRENQVAVEADFPIGSCVRVWVVRQYPTQWRWEVGKVQLEQANECQ